MSRFITVFCMASIFSSHLFAAACPASSATTTAGNGSCTVTGSASTIELNFNSGFDSSTAISAIDGNNGTTVGAQRKLSFIKAAEIIADQVNSAEAIVIDANFSALSCNASSATLGSAGASTNLGNVSNNKNGVNNPPAGQIANTFYPIGLLNAMGSDDYSAGSDVTAQFNANIGNTGCLQSSNGWYYGFSTPAANFIGFTTVLLHEITHGLGFASLTNASTGAKASGIDDIFSNFLYSLTHTSDWSVAGGLSNAQRAASAVSVTGLLWTGSNTNTQAQGLLTNGFNDVDSDGTFEAGDRVEMYAPNPVESGSSVSHFSTAAAPNELMEPQYTEGQYTLGLASYLLKDLGWAVTVSSNTPPTLNALDQSTNEDTALTGVDASGWAADVDGDTLTFSIASCPANITCNINTNGTGLSLTPATNFNGATNTVSITVTDGNGGSITDSFNLQVNGVNDAPTWSTISDRNVNIGTPDTINLASFASDLDGDSLTYTATACGTGLTCPISGSTLTINANSNSGTTVGVTIQANDSNGGLTSTSFNVTITNINTAPVLSGIGNQGAVVNQNRVITLSASDAEGNSLTYSEASDPNSVASIAGSTLTLSRGIVGSASVTIQVSDGLLTDSETFTFTTYPEPSIDINSTSLNPNDSVNIGNTSTGIDISAVNGAYTYALEFEGNSANNLINATSNTLSIAMPTSGQFAGEYVLTFTDSNTHTQYDFTLVRAPRLVFSANKLLANSQVQTLNIEGGASGTLYTLTSSESALGFVSNNTAVTSVTATNNASTFNRASLVLTTNTVSTQTPVNVSVSSVFATAHSSGITLEPARTHTLTITDDNDTALASADITLDTSALSDYNLSASYASDNQGQASIKLPDNNTSYTVQVSLNGYSTTNATLKNDTLSQTIVLEDISNPMNLSGTITAIGSLSFASELPVVTLVLADNTQINLVVSQTSSHTATFNYTHNLALGSVTSVQFSHSDGLSVIRNISKDANLTFNVLMAPNVQVVASTPTKTGSGGGIGPWLLAILCLLSTPMIRRKHR